MDFNDLVNKIQKLNVELTKVSQRRDKWEGKKKEIIEVLNKVKQYDEGNLFLLKYFNIFKNTGSVKVQRNSEDEITEETGNYLKYKIEGGYLSFQQHPVNGKIEVCIVPPYIDQVTEPIQEDIVEVKELEEITEDLIYNKFNEFLDVLINWRDTKAPS